MEKKSDVRRILRTHSVDYIFIYNYNIKILLQNARKSLGFTLLNPIQCLKF